MYAWRRGQRSFPPPRPLKNNTTVDRCSKQDIQTYFNCLPGLNNHGMEHNPRHSLVSPPLPRSNQTTYSESCSRAREGVYEPRERVNKNASDEVFDGGYRQVPVTRRSLARLTRSSIHSALRAPWWKHLLSATSTGLRYQCRSMHASWLVHAMFASAGTEPVTPARQMPGYRSVAVLPKGSLRTNSLLTNHSKIRPNHLQT